MPSPPEGIGGAVAQRSWLAAQQVVAALDDGDRCTQPGDRLRHLDADRPTAEHEQPGGHLGEPGDLAVRPQRGRSRSPRTGGIAGSDPAGSPHDLGQEPSHGLRREQRIAAV